MTIASRWRRRIPWRTVSIFVALSGVAAVAAVAVGARRRRRVTPAPARLGLVERELNRLVREPEPALHRSVVEEEAAPVPLADPEPAAEGPVLRPVPDPEPDEAPPPAVAPPSPVHSRRRRRGPLVVGLALLVGVLGVVTVLAVGGSDEGSAESGSGDPDDASTTSTTVVERSVHQLTPAEVFARAAQRLEESGTFAYQGTSRALDVSLVRPGPWLATDLDVSGQVDLASSYVHEVAVSGDGQAAEMVAEARIVRGRTADDEQALATADYGPAYEVGDGSVPRLGVAQLPQWLTAAVDHRDADTDTGVGADVPTVGGRTVQAVVPGFTLGEQNSDSGPVELTVTLTVDDRGDPVHVEVTTARDAGGSLHLALDITD